MSDTALRRTARLVLVRHGESLWNAEGRVQGQGGTGLTALGREQATAVAGHLTATYPEPAAVVSSDLQRVTETAEPYLSVTGYTAELDKRLREIDTGTWSGLLATEVAARFPEEFAAVRQGADIQRGGGETFAAMRARVAEALRDITHEIAGSDPGYDTDGDANGGAPSSAADGAPRVAPAHTPVAVIFTHGGPIRVSVATALGLPPGGHHLLDSPYNCSVTEFKVGLDPAGELGSVRLVVYNGVPVDHRPMARTNHDALGADQA